MENSELFQPLSHKRGYSFQATNPLLHYWIQSWNKYQPLLDIGCGNCTNANQAVKAGIPVFATESERVSVEALAEAYKDSKNISFHYLRFPNQVPFEDSSFSGILCSEVFHFLEHWEVIATVWELYRLLIPGGRVVVTCASEDMQALQSSGLKQIKIEQRKKFPMRLDAIHDHFDLLKKSVQLDESKLAWEIYESMKVTIKSYFNYFNQDQLMRVFRQIGFEIEVITTGPAPYYPLWVHGNHDQVRLVAMKPVLDKITM